MPSDPEPIRRQLRITCADALELLTDFLEEALSPADRARLHQHLAGCEACAAYLDQLRTTVTLVGTMKGDDAFEVNEQTMAGLLDLFRTHASDEGPAES